MNYIVTVCYILVENGYDSSRLFQKLTQQARVVENLHHGLFKCVRTLALQMCWIVLYDDPNPFSTI